MATYTWAGSPGTDWYSAGDWSPARIPSPGDEAILNDGIASIEVSDPAISGVQIRLGSGYYTKRQNA